MRPPWLTVRLKNTPALEALKHTAQSLELATVCQEAKCPNLFDCWSEGTATFMLMGGTCTRGCRFCDVQTGNPQGWLDAEEPEKLARTVAQAGWNYVVLTAVDRDDLPDGGALHMATCVKAVLKAVPEVKVEVLAPDFQGNLASLNTLLQSGLHVFAHNIETVERLQASVRDRRASYAQSLEVLRRVKETHPQVVSKSSLMLGLGERLEEVKTCLADLRQQGVEAITFGQYLQPSPKHLKVHEWIEPEVFDELKRVAEEEFGFAYCASGPLVRSSYKAGEYYMAALVNDRLARLSLNPTLAEAQR